MNILYIIFTIIAVYFFLVFFAFRLFVPFLGWSPKMHSETIPGEMTETIATLKASASNPREYAEAAYKFVQKKWKGGRFKTVLLGNLAFRSNLSTIWQSNGYAHCTTINYVFYNLLTHSGYFKPKDITAHVIFYNFFIHQYLKIKIDEQWLDADPATDYLKLPIGKRAAWFG